MLLQSSSKELGNPRISIAPNTKSKLPQKELIGSVDAHQERKEAEQTLDEMRIVVVVARSDPCRCAQVIVKMRCLAS